MPNRHPEFLMYPSKNLRFGSKKSCPNSCCVKWKRFMLTAIPLPSSFVLGVCHCWFSMPFLPGTSPPWGLGVRVPCELGPSTMKVMLTDGHDCRQQTTLKCECWEQDSQVGMARCLSVLWLGGHTIANSAVGWLNWKKKFFLHHIRRGFGLLELPGWCEGRWGVETHSN